MVYFRESKVLAYSSGLTLKQNLVSYILLPDGFRMISYEDTEKAFSTGEPLMDRYGIEYYYRRSLEPNSLVIVLEDGQGIAGLAMLIVKNSSLTVEMLAKNAHTDQKGVGVKLLNCIEEHVADQLTINSIRLDSLNRNKLVEFYKSRGFVPDGPPVLDKEWGILHPMSKRIAGIEN